ncbi:MAG: hypothetical protein NTZ97_01320 [Candidatus Moranbacteria bacterium]|nr:hypothetical protein [Candidatus Moranbacteria bacterium]
MTKKTINQKDFRIIGKDNPRRASRMEGKVKNRSIKNVRKKGKNLK